MVLNNTYGVSIRSNKKKCCLCLSDAIPNNSSSQIFFNENKYKIVYTELGKMLISILKVSNNTLTKYCCQVCIDTVVKCFDALLEINVAASLACQQLSVKKGGSFQCYKCNNILTTIDSFTQHFKSHLLEVNLSNSRDLKKEITKLDSICSDNDSANCNFSTLVDDQHIDEASNASEFSQFKVLDGGGEADVKDNSCCKDTETNLCHECGKRYGSVHSLKLHLKRHDPHYKGTKRKSRIKGSHLCEKCGKSFTTVETLRVHREKHDTTCTICGKSMYKKYMKRHLLLHDNHLPRLQLDRKQPKKILKLPALVATPLQCNHCDKSYIDRFLLVNHIAMMHGGGFEKGQKRGKRRGTECSLCGLVLLSHPKLKQHKKDEHGVVTEDRIQCELCKRWYSGKMCLRTHIKYEHMQMKPYSCKLCPKEFKRHQGLWAHMRVHQDLRPFECGVCQVRYRYRYEVVNHLGKHVRAGDVNLNEAFAKTILEGNHEPVMIYLKDQKFKHQHQPSHENANRLLK